MTTKQYLVESKNIFYYSLFLQVFNKQSEKKFKKWRMRILSARIFPKSFGGKIKSFKQQLLTRTTAENIKKNGACVF